MKKEVGFILVRIILTVLFICFIVPIWIESCKQMDSYQNIIISSENKIKFDYVKENNYIYKMSDYYAVNEPDKNIVKLNNESASYMKCNLMLRVLKDSTLNLDYLKYITDDEIHYLSDSYSHEDDSYKYYLLDQYMIDPSDNIDVEFMLWIDIDIDEDINNKHLYYSVYAYEDGQIVMN